MGSNIVTHHYFFMSRVADYNGIKKQYNKDTLNLKRQYTTLDSLEDLLYGLIEREAQFLLDTRGQEKYFILSVRGFTLYKPKFSLRVETPFTQDLYLKKSDLTDKEVLLQVARSTLSRIPTLDKLNFFLHQYLRSLAMIFRQGELSVLLTYNKGRIKNLVLTLPEQYYTSHTDISHYLRISNDLRDALNLSTLYTVYDDLQVLDLLIPKEVIHPRLSGKKAIFEISDSEVTFFYYFDRFDNRRDRILAIDDKGRVVGKEIQKVLLQLTKAVGGV